MKNKLAPCDHDECGPLKCDKGLDGAPCSPLASRPRHRIEIRSTFFDGWKTAVTLYASNDETAKAKSKEVFYYYRGCLESRIIYEENAIAQTPPDDGTKNL